MPCIWSVRDGSSAPVALVALNSKLHLRTARNHIPGSQEVSSTSKSKSDDNAKGVEGGVTLRELVDAPCRVCDVGCVRHVVPVDLKALA
jgi:hypothetical protein